jgi:hypothetical protein
LNAVAFDLDDTLLRDDLTISDFTVRVFQALHAKGFHIIAASGRSPYSMKPYLDQLGCIAACISSNGAEIWEGPARRLIRQEFFSAELSREIALFAEKHSCYAQVYKDDCFYFSRRGPWAERYASATRLKGVFVGNLSTFIREPRNKILLIDSKEKISSMYAEAAELFGGRASVTCSKPIYLEFNPVNAVKGKALAAACAFLGTRPEDTVAFGDSLNDLTMLQAAGIGVTVSNGWKEIRPYCDDICQSNNEDGPARYLNEHFLNGEVV